MHEWTVSSKHSAAYFGVTRAFKPGWLDIAEPKRHRSKVNSTSCDSSSASSPAIPMVPKATKASLHGNGSISSAVSLIWRWRRDMNTNCSLFLSLLQSLRSTWQAKSSVYLGNRSEQEHSKLKDEVTVPTVRLLEEQLCVLTRRCATVFWCCSQRALFFIMCCSMQGCDSSSMC